MGYGFDVICTKCGYKKTFFLGTGMMYGFLTEDLVKRHIKGKKMRSDIIDKISTGYQPENFEHVLMQCPQCQSIYERFYIKFNEEQSYGYETRYKCHKCKKELQHIDENQIEKSKCPKCYENSLEKVGFILWD